MKHLPFLAALAAASICALLAGCAATGGGSPMSRIDANRAEYETWPIEVKQAVLDGRVEKGMTPAQVEVAIGKPAKVEYKEGRTSSQEIWIYTQKSGSPLQGSTVSVGTYGVGVSTSTGGGYTEEYEVVFENGVVINSDVPMETK